jgi:ADP-heptose:LPS heptosyltransferase
MKRADLVLCNDTGIMHVSCAVGARTLAVFGPTDPKRWAPKSPNLYAVQAPQGRLEKLTEESVISKAWEILL